MSVETKQQLIEIIRNETEIAGNTCERIAIAFTQSNQEKLEKNGSNLSQSDIDILKNKLGIFEDNSDVNSIDLLGEIITTSDSITIELSNSDVNKITLGGIVYYTYSPSEFTFTPVSEDKIKSLIIYARSTPDLFYLAEGDEGYEAVEPSIPNDAFVIKRITVTSEGQYIDPEIISGFVEKEEESWKTIYTGSATSFSIDYTDKRTRFKINSSVDIPKTLTAINFASETNRAVEFWIYNNTNLNINIPASSTSGLSKGFANINAPFVVLPKSKALLKYNPETNLIECWKDNATGGLTSVNVGTDLTGNGTSGSPLNLSASKNAEIAGKENASNKVTAWSATTNNTNYPSEKLVKDSLDLIKPATQAEAESQTAPTVESNKYITTFSLWKWLQALTYIILKPNSTTAIANRLRSSGSRLFYADNSAVERGIAYDDEKMNLPSTNGTFAIQKSGTDISFIPTFSTIENLFFDQNGKWAFPVTTGASYSTLRTGNITQVGHSLRTSYFIPIINYTFNTTTTIAYRRGSTMYFTYTKTFKYIQQFDINSSVATTRILVGLSNMFGSVNPTNVSADTLIRTIGVCKTSSSNNLSWIWNDATGSANVEDMGSGFPANDFNSIYRLTIDSSTAGASVSMKLDRINKTTGAITSVTKVITSDFYVTDDIYPILYCCDSASTGTGLVGDYGIIGYTNLV